MTDAEYKAIRMAVARGVLGVEEAHKVLMDPLDRLRSAEAALREELARMRQEKCSVCAGDGKPLSGGPCICGGTGRAVDEIAGVRAEAIRARRQLAELVAALPRCEQSGCSSTATRQETPR